MPTVEDITKTELTPEQKAIIKSGDITTESPVSIVATSGKDTYIVRTQIEGSTIGDSKQEILTKAEIEARGLQVPEAQQRASEIHQATVNEGYAAGEAKRAEFAAIDNPIKTPEQILATEINISEKVAKETIDKYKENPSSNEFKNLSAKEIMSLNKATGFNITNNLVEVGLDIGGNQFITQNDLNKAREQSPILEDTLRKAGVETYNKVIKDTKQSTNSVIKSVAKLSESKNLTLLSNITVIGTSLETNKILVKNNNTGEESWQFAEPSLVAQYTTLINLKDSNLIDNDGNLDINNALEAGYSPEALKSILSSPIPVDIAIANTKPLIGAPTPDQLTAIKSITKVALDSSRPDQKIAQYYLDNIEQQSSLSKVANSPDVSIGDNKYNLVRYFQNNPDDVSTVYKAFPNLSIDEIDSLNTATQHSKGFWTNDNQLKAYDALVAGAMTQNEIKTLTGQEIDTSIKVPFTTFGDIYYKYNPIISKINNKPIEAGQGLQGIGLVNYPEWYKKAQSKYNEIYGQGEAGKATGRMIGGEIAASVFGPVPIKLIEPSYGIKTTNIGDWSQLAVSIALLTSPLWLSKVTAALPRLNPLGEVTLTLKDGSEVSIWRGLKAIDQPLIGKSGGKIVLGDNKLNLPKAEELKLPGLEGIPYEPRTSLETRILTSNESLEKLGFTPSEITKIQNTLIEVKSFYGEKSPFLNKNIITDQIDTLSKTGVETVLKQASKESDIVEKVFGSSTMRPQLSPEALEEWTNKFGRVPGDIDIQLGKITSSEAKEFTARLAKSLNDAGEDVWISEENPMLIKAHSRSTDAIRHAIDVHYENEPITSLTSTSPEEFQSMVYGLKKTGPLATVDYEGIGKIKLAGLSETGVGKTEQVIGWRIDPKTNEVIISPEAHRMKDYIDLYEIIKTFKGEETANKWAKSIGLDIDSLSQLADEVPNRTTWEFNPSKDSNFNRFSNTSPIVQITSPSLLSAASSIPTGVLDGKLVVTSLSSPSVSTTDISKAVVSPSLNSTSASIKLASKETLSSVLPSKESTTNKELSEKESLASSTKATSISSESKISSPSAITPSSKIPISSTSIPTSPISKSPPSSSSPEISSNGVPTSPSTPNIPSSSIPSLSRPSIPTSPKIPVPTKVEIPIITSETLASEKTSRGKQFPITFKYPGKYWTLVNPPYRQGNISMHKNRPTKAIEVDSIDSAYRTIQALGGDANIMLDIDAGAMDIHIENPSRQVGKPGAIRFNRDRYNKTRQELTLKGVKLS